ncbi:hypothetical protein GCM10008090_35150 [Arenicella chitinivorans]|uniref:Uncharacterized protein n=1 Tax=Arenicella chitinivorans TaxID=1329800 RepID=A0A918S3C1_9GAMM|nr:hypothetical protein [Arenicella chitinivorans]GHA22364.1 hypothetical protein GCM10008090_35150 [Arenicella chitinivorans]
MSDEEWKVFFKIANETLGKGSYSSLHSNSWCSWTTYQRLSRDSGYYTSGIPSPEELENDRLNDGGTWGQPFPYAEIAHLIIPKQFVQEGVENSKAVWRRKTQDIDLLAKRLSSNKIPFLLSEWALEIRSINCS